MENTKEEKEEQLTHEDMLELKRMLSDYKELKGVADKNKKQEEPKPEIKVKKPPKPYWVEGMEEDFEESRDSENNFDRPPSVEKSTHQTQVDSSKNKVWIGVMCAFLPLIVALIVGFAVYKSGTEERRTFWKGFGIAIACAAVVGLFIGLIAGV